MKTSDASIQLQPSEEGSSDSLPATDQFTKFCPRYHHAMVIIGKRWTGAILRVLMYGPHRYNEILSAIPGISDRLLTERLRDLEAEGLVTRRIASTTPIRVEYALTAQGQELETAVRAISAWAEKWLPV
ncbi:transcriptional regulator [Ktedonobacter sp. SOSP1-85]|uniref:winged helix-turn-helix transcriptional regulator n=1 Tax=Ktedonobacter sp. SOSP1-85 TaxID=2778367 RepID=UPI0019155D6C|nr:helix-turn-helix domain-containing protein [Ktedonobacter sp. SOSP1-85]GHO80480.1 transcriptional regulator [Ktedonobacter sp. SOSP1-85]